MKNVFLFSMIWLLFQGKSYAQSDLQNANWTLNPGSGLDFLFIPPQPFTSSIVTNIATASVSDQNGQLLFYTDGDTVWNADNTVMTNGTGLLGNSSDYDQNVVIVPNPTDINRYYIFSVAPGQYLFENFHGLRFSEVDLSNGSPEVIAATMNTPLTDGVLPIDDSHPLNYGKITSARHSNGKDYWLIAEFKDQIYAYLINDQGVSLSTVSDAPFSAAVNLFPGIQYLEPDMISTAPTSGSGPMKISDDGHRILIGYSDTLMGSSNSGGRLAEGLFDNTTGSVYNFIDLPTPTGATAYMLSGAEFSADGNEVYELLQGYIAFFDVPLSGSSLDIKNSGLSVPTIEVRNLQRAIDGNLYFIAADFNAPNPNFLSVITNANSFSSHVVHFQTVDTGATVLPSSLPAWVQWQPCRYFLTSNQNITSTRQEQRNSWIVSTDRINLPASDQVVYHAGNFVELRPGFETLNDSQFTAYIEGCTGDFFYRGGPANPQYGNNPVKESNPTKGSALQLHPNPTNSILYLETVGINITEIQITAIDGKLIKTAAVHSNSESIDVSGFSKGMYLITIHTDDGQIIRKKFLKN